MARRRSAPSFPIAYVRYHDHCWLESKDLRSIREARPVVVEETGFLLHETPEYVTLARERATDGERGRISYEDVTIIMRSDILQLETFAAPAAPPKARRGRKTARKGAHRPASTTRPKRA